MIIKYNNINLFEKMIIFLERNSHTKDFEIINEKKLKVILFKCDRFGDSLLSNIFWYWGLNFVDYVKNFRVEPLSYRSIKISIWLKKLPDIATCSHKFINREDWGYYICNKCGFFSKKIEEKLESIILEK